MSKKCFFFGTFNPIHVGHLIMAETALEQFGFDSVVFVPAGVPPHRHAEPMLASALDRFNMVQLAIASNPAFSVSDVELRRSGPSYTVDTVEALLQEMGPSVERLPIIMGADALAGLKNWHRIEDLIGMVWFLQAPRIHQKVFHSIEIDGICRLIKTDRIDMAEIGISSTEVRRRISQGHSLRYRVSEPVLRYMLDNKLYQPD